MKKLLFLTSIFLLSFNSNNAQNKGSFEFGGHLGLNLSNVSTIDNKEVSGVRVAFNIGAVGEYYFSETWGIKMKLIYDSKGWANDYIIDQNNNQYNTNIIMNYLSIPVMANWHFGATKKWYIHFGLFAALLINAKDSARGMDLDYGINNFDFGFSSGIGYKFNVNEQTKLFVEYEGQNGLLDIFKNNEGTIVRNNRSSFNVGVLINL